ncbi:mitogen-activated protein kinase kinase kinase 11-like [Antechinus flavipes]|uniref:mitogen-activated protein kinase kinase kinase 11-like n=1 Tax=Antechinus flavipes TaxID=38775 RepID=UPI002235EEA0|nr:mitogen-activated protein kinase kinase kinase 11-like [Antechinus flavipes]
MMILVGGGRGAEKEVERETAGWRLDTTPRTAAGPPRSSRGPCSREQLCWPPWAWAGTCSRLAAEPETRETPSPKRRRSPPPLLSFAFLPKLRMPRPLQRARTLRHLPAPLCLTWEPPGGQPFAKSPRQEEETRGGAVSLPPRAFRPPPPPRTPGPQRWTSSAGPGLHPSGAALTPGVLCSLDPGRPHFRPHSLPPAEPLGPCSQTWTPSGSPHLSILLAHSRPRTAEPRPKDMGGQAPWGATEPEGSP